MPKIAACILGAALVLALAAAAEAKPRHRAVAVTQGSFGSNATVFRRAERGDPRAQAYLGFMYQTGRGLPQYYPDAVYWYHRAAEQGYGPAQLALGLLFDKGHGVPSDLVQAHKWLNLSAAHARGSDREFKLRLRDAIASKIGRRALAEAQWQARAWYPKPER